MNGSSSIVWPTMSVPPEVKPPEIATACCLMPTSVTLHQYDQSLLDVKGECQAEMIINDKVISASFIVVDVSTRYPFLEGTGWACWTLMPPSYLGKQQPLDHSVSTFFPLNPC